jgi:hypothetical protein
MITAPPGPDAGEKSERWEMANRRNFGEAGGFEVLRSLLVQYSAEDARSTDKDSILLNVVLLFHLTLVSRRATTDFLTCSQVCLSIRLGFAVGERAWTDRVRVPM